jgi:hypothetical protein
MSQRKTPNGIVEELIEQNYLSKWGVSVRHIEQIPILVPDSNHKVIFSIGRHPHLFGRPSLGKRSSAYAEVIQTFEVNLLNKEVKLMEERVLDINIDYYALAAEDVEILLDGGFLDNDIINELVILHSKEEVEKFANLLFGDFGWMDSYHSDYENSLPEDFNSKLIATIKDVFIERIVERWIRDKEDWKQGLEENECLLLNLL